MSLPEPINISNEMIPQGFRKVYIGPPADDTGSVKVTGVDAVYRHEPGEPPMYLVLMKLDDYAVRDIVMNDGQIWLCQITDSMVPFSFIATNSLSYD